MATIDETRPGSTELALPSPRSLDRKLARGLAGFALLVVALGAVFWALTGSIALVAGVMAFYLVFGSLYLLGAWGSTRWLSRVCNVAARALEAGRVAEARALLDEHLIRSAANTPMYAIAIWLRARVAMREGELDDARDRLTMLLGWHWYERGGLLHAHASQVRAELGLCLALAGRLDEAERERDADESDARADDPDRSRGREADARARKWLVADAVLLARRERFAELLDRLGQRATLIAELPGSDRQWLALLHDWADFRLARDEGGFRAPHAGIELPEPLRGGFEIERVEPMIRAWPELHDFVIHPNDRARACRRSEPALRRPRP